MEEILIYLQSCLKKLEKERNESLFTSQVLCSKATLIRLNNEIMELEYLIGICQALI